VDSVTEAVTTVGADGTARVSVAQPTAAGGTNRIAIEVIKADPAGPAKYKVVSKGETKVTWQAPSLSLTVSAPKTLALSQEVPVTYAVAGSGPAPTEPVTVTATVPPGLEVVRTEPRAAVDGDQLVWTLPAESAGKRRAVEAVYRPVRIGAADLTADARTAEGQSAHGSAAVQVTEAKLLLKLDGPSRAVVGEALPFRLVVTNVGDAPADRVRVRARLDDGLETANRSTTLDETIASLAPGQSRTLELPVSAKQPGRLSVQAGATAGANLVGLPQTATVEVQDARLTAGVHGPGRGYVGQEVTWKVVVRNLGETPLGTVVLKADLPDGVKFVRATEGGRSSGKQVVWDLGTAPARQERTVEVTAACERLTGRAAFVAVVSASPIVDRGGAVRPVSLVKPIGSERPVEVPFEIIGIPALQMSIKDAADPIGVGQRTTYTVRLKNAGTLAARRVELSADVPDVMRPLRATGPGPAGRADGSKVLFPAIDSLAPNAEATFVIEVEGRAPGDGRFRAEARSALLAQPLRAEEPTRVLGRESPPPGR
jgi:uncharacterized repeat protein (TIGR01451 family)